MRSGRSARRYWEREVIYGIVVRLVYNQQVRLLVTIGEVKKPLCFWYTFCLSEDSYNSSIKSPPIVNISRAGLQGELSSYVT